MVFYTTMAENRVLNAQTWNQVINFGTGSRYPLAVTSHYSKLPKRPVSSMHVGTVRSSERHGVTWVGAVAHRQRER